MAKNVIMQESLNHNISQKNLRYEIEFLDMIRGPRKHQVFDGYFRWVCPDMPVHAQSDKK